VDEDEIIDCHNIYKQPSLNHHSLHNHSIQIITLFSLEYMKHMRPSMNPKNIKLDNFGTLQLTRTWHKYGACPQGTIPIRRNIKDYRPALSRKHRLSKFSHSKASNTLEPNKVTDDHEVCQPRYGDYQTRFFILWTISTDGYRNSCTNLECEGFVHISPDIALGCNFTEMSTFKGDQKDATFSIHKWKLVGTSTRYFSGILSKFSIHPIIKNTGNNGIRWRNL
ncbi:hypothetical protein MKX03_011192, partial [Papaver bracteatum]